MDEWFLLEQLAYLSLCYWLCQFHPKVPQTLELQEICRCGLEVLTLFATSP